jgi:hypothetical protein
MLSPTFRFFELVCSELCTQPSVVITREDLAISDADAPMLDELKQEYEVSTSAEAIEAAVKFLHTHFKAKGSILPFAYDTQTGRFELIDLEFMQFVEQMGSIRSLGKRSREFEVQVADWLSRKVTGNLHRVGFPRDTKKKAIDFRAHLRTLGFNNGVLLGSEKDGGLDLLWELPLGSVPHRPIVSVQCKNGEYNIGQADLSIGAGSRSFACHIGLQPTVHVTCVLFNDYIYSEILINKPFNFVPLGLSDLSLLNEKVSLTKL